MFAIGDRIICDYPGNRFCGLEGTVRTLLEGTWVRITWDHPPGGDDGGMWSDKYIRHIEEEEEIQPEDWS